MDVALSRKRNSNKCTSRCGDVQGVDSQGNVCGLYSCQEGDGQCKAPGYILVGRPMTNKKYKSCADVLGYEDVPTKAECEQAAAYLQTGSTNALIFGKPELPSKCQMTGNQLFWDANADASGDSGYCGKDDRPCICRSKLYCETAVTELYQTILCRKPDSGGLQIWVEQCESGRSMESIEQAFKTSVEYKKCAVCQNHCNVLDSSQQLQMTEEKVSTQSGDMRRDDMRQDNMLRDSNSGHDQYHHNGNMMDGIDGRKIGRMIGGWEKHTTSEREMMEKWHAVLAEESNRDLVLKQLGEPVSVETQVVAGTNYRFKFADGTRVTVFESLMNKLKIEDIKRATDGFVGKHYCTWGPDYSCFKDGWPSCCNDKSEKCPEERELCDRTFVKPPGSDYCTYGPNYQCYKDGWPSCCQDKSEKCPEQRPLCDDHGSMMTGGWEKMSEREMMETWDAILAQDSHRSLASSKNLKQLGQPVSRKHRLLR